MMKKFYAVEQKYFDNGAVSVRSHIVNAPEKPENISQETGLFDIYIDYFDNPVEAEDFRQKALKA